VDKIRWVGGQKISIFVHVQGKNVHVVVAEPFLATCLRVPVVLRIWLFSTLNFWSNFPEVGRWSKKGCHVHVVMIDPLYMMSWYVKSEEPSHKGPSIKDVSQKGEGGGYKKCPKRRHSLVDLRRQGEGGYPKNLKFGETSFMDGP
jgi:hypothetical protein